MKIRQILKDAKKKQANRKNFEELQQIGYILSTRFEIDRRQGGYMYAVKQLLDLAY